MAYGNEDRLLKRYQEVDDNGFTSTADAITELLAGGARVSRTWPGAKGSAAVTGTSRCGGCGHKEHRGACLRKRPSRCVPLDSDGDHTGFACGDRPPCPCPWRTCPCGDAVAVAACDGDPGFEETVERGSAGHPDGTLAVRRLADSTLMARPVAKDGELAAGEWRAIDHDARCPKATKRGVVDATDLAGNRVPV